MFHNVYIIKMRRNGAQCDHSMAPDSGVAVKKREVSTYGVQCGAHPLLRAALEKMCFQTLAAA